MKKVFIGFLTCLMLFLVVTSLFSCSSEEKYPLAPVEAGLRYEYRFAYAKDESRGRNVYCGYRFEKNQYEVNTDIPFTLYYGADLSARLPYYEQFEKKYPVHVFFTKDKEFTIIKTYTFEEMFSEKYDISMSYERTETHNIETLNYNHNEPMVILKEMLTDEKGTIRIEIASVEKVDAYVHRNVDIHGFDYQLLYYRIENGMVYLSNESSFLKDW